MIVCVSMHNQAPSVMQELATKYKISAMPTFIAFKDGEKVEQIVGADMNKVTAIITQCAPASFNANATSYNRSSLHHAARLCLPQHAHQELQLFVAAWGTRLYVDNCTKPVHTRLCMCCTGQSMQQARVQKA